MSPFFSYVTACDRLSLCSTAGVNIKVRHTHTHTFAFLLLLGPNSPYKYQTVLSSIKDRHVVTRQTCPHYTTLQGSEALLKKLFINASSLFYFQHVWSVLVLVLLLFGILFYFIFVLFLLSEFFCLIASWNILTLIQPCKELCNFVWKRAV